MEFLEIPIFDDDVFKLGVRFLLDGIFLFLLLWLAIRPTAKEREFAFSVVMMNITVFFICFTLKKLDLGLGMALGLFAIFGILRYRADAIRTKEMTYLFIVIGIAVINALSNRKTSYVELLLVNFVILAFAVLKESNLIPYSIFRSDVAEPEPTVPAPSKKNKKRSSPQTPEKSNSKTGVANGSHGSKQKHTIKYDQVQWLGPEHKQQLLADLRQRTGMKITRFKINDIDLTQPSATLSVWIDAPTTDSDSTGGSEPSLPGGHD